MKISKNIIYVIVGISVYPILSYLLYDTLKLPKLPYQFFIQVFFSAPLLLISGGILFFAYRRRIEGIVIGLIGVIWLIGILGEIIEKTY